jgi:hypothetical protein
VLGSSSCRRHREERARQLSREPLRIHPLTTGVPSPRFACAGVGKRPHDVGGVSLGEPGVLLVQTNEQFADFVKVARAPANGNPTPPAIDPPAMATAARQPGQDLLGPSPSPPDDHTTRSEQTQP